MCMRVALRKLPWPARVRATPKRALFLVGYDGTHRIAHDLPPVAALERGPVWVIDAISGHIDSRAAHASLAGIADTSVLVLYDDDRLLGAIPAGFVMSYETVTILDPAVETSYGRRLWQGLEFGDELTLVYVYTGVFH